MTSHTLINVYFESQVAAQLMVPGTYSFRFHNEDRFPELFRKEAETSPSVRQWCRLLQTVYENLFARKLMIVTKDWKADPLSEQYPSSPHRTIDMRMSFARYDPPEIAEILMQEFEPDDGHEYLVHVTLATTRRHVLGNGFVDQSDMSRLLRSLIYHINASRAMEPMQDRGVLLFQA